MAGAVACWPNGLAATAQAPRSLYIHGEVGRGKTMLMDLFFASVTGWPKRRIHFHAFMQDVHRQRAAPGGEMSSQDIADERGGQGAAALP